MVSKDDPRIKNGRPSAPPWAPALDLPSREDVLRQYSEEELTSMCCLTRAGIVFGTARVRDALQSATQRTRAHTPAMVFLEWVLKLAHCPLPAKQLC